MNYNVTCIIVTFGMRIFHFSLHKHKIHKTKKRFFFRIPCGTITKIHLNSSPPPPMQSQTKWFVWQWENYNQDLSLSFSLSLFHNGKILRIKHWNIGPTIPLQNFPSMFWLFNFNSSQVSTLFPCTRNTQNRFLVYLTTWSHITVVSRLSTHPFEYAFFGKKFRVQDSLVEH
jgi:hypothetical protein